MRARERWPIDPEHLGDISNLHGFGIGGSQAGVGYCARLLFVELHTNVTPIKATIVIATHV